MFISAINMSQSQDQHSCKRIVLLFKLHNDEDIVKAFLQHCHHPESEYEENKHFIYLDPIQHISSLI